MYINSATIIGRVTKQPEAKTFPSGQMVTSFSIATNRDYKTKDGEKKEETEFHNIVAFGRTAEVISQYVVKGQELYVEGRIQTRSWETDGKKNYRTEIICEKFQFGQKPKGAYEGAPEVHEDTDGMASLMAEDVY